MISKAITQTALAAGALFSFAAPQMASAAVAAIPCQTGPAPSNVMSCAAGMYANLSVMNGVVDATIGPLADAFGTAPGAYNIPTQELSANDSADFGALGSLGVTTGVITDQASSLYTGTLATLSSTGTSTVNGLNLALGILPPALSALTLNATTLTSTFSASKINGFTTSGSGSIDASALVHAPVNDNLLTIALQNTLGLNIMANDQTPMLYDTADRIGTQTSALAAFFNSFGYGDEVLDGTVLIADSAAVPEPATWAMMIFGFGVAGGLTRRRQIAARAFA